MSKRKVKRYTLSEFREALARFAPGADIEVLDSGQVVVYTDLYSMAQITNKPSDVDKPLHIGDPMWGTSVNPDTTEQAPDGQMWIPNGFGGYNLEYIGASFLSSVASETYWAS